MKKQVLFIVLMLMPLMVSADYYRVNINGIYYNLNSTDKVAEVTSVPNGTAKYSGSVVIPKTVFYGGRTYSVTSIDDKAFMDCSELTSITIPNSVTSIGDEAFRNCSELTSITIPNSVTSIGVFAFAGCTGLTSVTIPNSVTSIGHCAFAGCTGLASVTIPNSVTSTGSNVFSGCSGLPVVNNCRYADTYLVEVVDKTISSCIIKEGTRFIDESAFLCCSSLTSITIPNSVTSIGVFAFAGCTGLTSITIPNSVTYIDVGAFAGCTGLTSVTIPNGVTSIKSSAFSDCTGLTSVTIGNSVTTIEDAFFGCTGLTSITIPNSVTSIGINAFQGCSSLISVTIPNSVTSIGDNAFQDCSKLSSVSIGKGIISVGAKAFANCPDIKEVYCYAKDVPTISNNTFENSYYIKFATLYVPESSVDLYKASAWSQFGNIVSITGGNEGERCAKPVITLLANGKMKVESATEGATCVTNITASNAEPLTDGEISLNSPTVYTVTSYAMKDGYNDSEVATATFRYEKAEGDINGDGNLNISDVVHLVNMILGQ